MLQFLKNAGQIAESLFPYLAHASGGVNTTRPPETWGEKNRNVPQRDELLCGNWDRWKYKDLPPTRRQVSGLWRAGPTHDEFIQLDD